MGDRNLPSINNVLGFPGGAGGEYVELLAQVSGIQPSADASQGARAGSEDSSQLDLAVDALNKKAPDTINLNKEDIAKLQKDDAFVGKKTEARGSIGGSSQKQKGGKAAKEPEKDCVLFTCGHHFTNKDFKVRSLFFGELYWNTVGVYFHVLGYICELYF